MKVIEGGVTAAKAIKQQVFAPESRQERLIKTWQ